jgi:hypothetical protein
VTPRTASRLFTSAVVGTAVLIAAYTANPWVALVSGILFVFVTFPRWRGKTYRLVEDLIHLAGKMQKGGTNDPDDS